ncbi:MAG: transcription elongation factor GreAB [Nitrospira sp. SCN 59-13]|nr:MAG: transcription elongation factor GreAB [Nitrospira sp. SCN 59-13]
MNPRTVCMTAVDLSRLRDVLRSRTSVGRYRDHLDRLEEELDRADIVDPSAIPANVVTMNSQVRIEDVETGMENVYTLVFPSEASIAEKKISILAPIGTALLGSREGSTVNWPVPAGRRTMLIKDVLYQPEAAGDYHL